MSTPSPISESSSPRFVYLAAGITALGGLLFGYDTGVISGAILFIKQEFSLTATVQEWVVSIVLVGAMLGALLGGALADKFGRRRILISTALLFAAGAIGTALAPTLTWLIIGRLVVGTAIGGASLVAPLYIAEIAPAQIRGRLVALNQVALTSGIVISFLVDYAFAPTGNWRWMMALAMIPATLLAIGMYVLPENPRWLLSHGFPQRAQKALRHIHGIQHAPKETQQLQENSVDHQGGWRQLLSHQLRPALLIGIILAIFQQITGINTIIYYAPTIFLLAGFHSTTAAILATVGLGLVNVLFTLTAMWLLDRVGRRPLLLTGIAGMVVSLLVLGWALISPYHQSITGWGASLCLASYIAFFAIGLGPVFWLLIAEIYPLQVRGTAMGLATLANWVANFLVAVSFLSLIHGVGLTGTFWIYAIIGLGAWFFTYTEVPETRGKTLEQIEAHWQAGKHPRAMYP